MLFGFDQWGSFGKFLLIEALYAKFALYFLKHNIGDRKYLRKLIIILLLQDVQQWHFDEEM